MDLHHYPSLPSLYPLASTACATKWRPPFFALLFIHSPSIPPSIPILSPWNPRFVLSLSLSMSALSPWPPFIIDSQPPAFLSRLVWCLVVYTRSTQTSADASCAPTKKNPIDTPYSFLTTLVSILFWTIHEPRWTEGPPGGQGPLPLLYRWLLNRIVFIIPLPQSHCRLNILRRCTRSNKQSRSVFCPLFLSTSRFHTCSPLTSPLGVLVNGM